MAELLAVVTLTFKTSPGLKAKFNCAVKVRSKKKKKQKKAAARFRCSIREVKRSRRR